LSGWDRNPLIVRALAKRKKEVVEFGSLRLREDVDRVSVLLYDS